MKKRKIVMSVLIVTMLASCMACGKIHDHKGDTLKNSVTEKVTVSDTEVAEKVEPTDIKVDDLKPLADAGVITGVKDITVEEGYDANLNDLVYADKNIVKSVDIDDSAVDYSKAGTYKVIYTITFDGDKLRDYVKDNNLNVNFDIDGDTIVVKTTVTVTVATKEDADKAIANGATDVVTPETEKSVAESNKAKANDNAVANKPAEKPAGNTGNSNAGKNNSNGNSNANTGNSGNNGNAGNSGDNSNHNGNSNGDNGNHNGNTKPSEQHTHKYVEVSRTDATCNADGVITKKCSCGDVITEKNGNALGHNPETRTETVTVKDAYDEDVWESRYICNGCGASFKTEIEVGRHILANTSGNCNNYYSDSVKVNTIHHDAVTETRTYKVCSRCGKPVK